MLNLESARQEMIEHQLRRRGIRDERVLSAMATIRRELFLDPDHREFAYDDRALPAAYGQTISQPYVVARMTEALELQPGMRVLEVGTGTGYQAAVLLLLGVDLWTIERIAELSETACDRLRGLGLGNVHCVVGDGSLGYAEAAPYDRILVTAAAPEVPRSLLDQLKSHGTLIIPVGGADDQVVVKVDKRGDRIIEHPVFPCRFVKLLGSGGWHTGTHSI